MKRFKKLLPIVMATVMIAATMGGCASANKGTDTKSGDTKSDKSSVLIGSAIYKFDDTFMTGVRTAMEHKLKKKVQKLN